MKTKTQLQYTPVGRFIKRILHTKVGAYLAYKAGIAGFNRIDAIHRDSFGNIKGLSHSYNSRVDKGGDLIASLITGASQNSITSPLPPKYIALSTATLTPAHGDTTLASETSVAGLGRALGTQGSYVTPTTLDGAASYTVTKTFTLTGSTTTVVSAALFDAVSTGNMFVEANLSSSAAMATNDTLSITWTVNL